MRAVEHYLEAERLLDPRSFGDGRKTLPSPEATAAAQAHALLALAGATALQAYSKGGEAELDDWEFHVGGEERP